MSSPTEKERLLRKIDEMNDLILRVLESGGPKELEEVKQLLDRARLKVRSMLPKGPGPSD